jgi:hypothetical protein
MRRPIELPGCKVREMMLGSNFGRSRMDGVAMQNAPDPALGHACPHLDKNDPRCQDRFRMAELDAMYRYCLGGFYGCPMFHRINRWNTNRNNPLLVSLANDIHNSKRFIEVIHLQRAHFTGTQACRVHHFQHGAVAKPQRAMLRAGRFHQLLHLPGRQRPRQLLPSGWSFEQSCRVLLKLEISVHPAKEHTHGCQMSHDGNRIQPTLA